MFSRQEMEACVRELRSALPLPSSMEQLAVVKEVLSICRHEKMNGGVFFQALSADLGRLFKATYSLLKVAVDGISANIIIECGFGGQEEAPFWFINNTAYEMFSIPQKFPSIPVVRILVQELETLGPTYHLMLTLFVFIFSFFISLFLFFYQCAALQNLLWC